jgi:2-phosphoglycerate kinase
MENNKIFSFWKTISIFTRKLIVLIWSPPGFGAPETAPQHSRKKPLALMVQPDAV